MLRAQQLGRYQVLDRLASGGMAEIFRAKTFDSEGRVHLVAVKRVLPHLTADEEFLKMLVDEAKLTATLDHQNIARVYEFVHSGGEYFMAMEYVDGKDVRALLERHRRQNAPIPPEHVAWVGMEVASALGAAHVQRDAQGRAMNIVHRDVSPSNMLCSYGGEVKLCDFGIAKATLTRTQTKSGVIKGKVKYMSPEQAMGRKLDARSDLFSLGTCLYEMLTLEPPFKAATEVELIFAVRDARTRPARSVVPSVPEELEAILARLMARSRADRFESGEELAAALRGFLDVYKPGYRRSYFGRFMRELFAVEIERELRILEEYVIEGGDPIDVGENLIADALPAGAPYVGFHAGGTGPDTAPDQPAELPPLPDLHGHPTQILRPGDAKAGDLHQQKTQILTLPAEREPPILSGRYLMAEDSGEAGDGLPPLHVQRTQILKRPAARDGRPPLSGVKTHIHGQPPKAPPGKPAQEAQDEEESTSIPIGDDEIDPV